MKISTSIRYPTGDNSICSCTFLKKKNWSYLSFLHLFLPLTLGDISAYSFRHGNNIQLPLSKRSLLHN